MSFVQRMYGRTDLSSEKSSSCSVDAQCDVQRGTLITWRSVEILHVDCPGQSEDSWYRGNIAILSLLSGTASLWKRIKKVWRLSAGPCFQSESILSRYQAHVHQTTTSVQKGFLFSSPMFSDAATLRNRAA